jgi:ATP synthase protein I
VVNVLTKPGKRYALIQIMMQLVVTLLSCFVVYLNWGFAQSQSALAGGAVSILPSIIFAYKAFQYAGASKAKQVVDSFNKGSKLKMLITAVLFMLCFKFLHINPLIFFVTYSLTMVAPWLTALVNKFYFNQQ